MTWPPRPFYQVIANIRRLASTLQRQGSSECGSDRDNLISANRSPSALTNAFQAACTKAAPKTIEKTSIGITRKILAKRIRHHQGTGRRGSLAARITASALLHDASQVRMGGRRLKTQMRRNLGPHASTLVFRTSLASYQDGTDLLFCCSSQTGEAFSQNNTR